MKTENKKDSVRVGLKLHLDVVLAYKEEMIKEIEHMIEGGCLTTFDIKYTSLLREFSTDLPIITIINCNDEMMKLQDTIFTELKQKEKKILKRLSISEEEYEMSRGGLRVAFGKHQTERFGL